jgi:hypothetical protein
MTASLDSSKITQVHIEENAETIYYNVETKKDSSGLEIKTLKGMSKIQCSEIILRFISGEVDEVVFLDHPTSIGYPMNQIPPKDLYLKGFTWQIGRKPPRPFPE